MCAFSSSARLVGDTRPARIVWYGHRGEDALALVPANGLAAVVCCDWSDGLARLSKRIPVVSVEHATGRRELWSSASLGMGAADAVKDCLIHAVSSGTGTVLLFPYMANDTCERAAKPFGTAVQVVAAPASVVHRLSDKIYQRQLFARTGLPTPPAIDALLGEVREKWSNTHNVGAPAIVQRARGSLGMNTFRILPHEGMPKATFTWRPDEKVLVSKYVEGVAVNVNAVIKPTSVVVGWPSVMITGADCCSPRDVPFAFCGNDYCSTGLLPSHILGRLFELVRLAGETLRTEGLLGLFGLDLVFDGAAWWILEANCRLQGSTALLSILERDAGTPPLVREHFRVLTGADVWGDSSESSREPRPVGGAQIVLYQRDTRVVRVPAAVQSEANDGRAWRLCGAAVEGTDVAPGAILGRIESNGCALGESLTELTGPALGAVVDAYDRFVSNERRAEDQHA